MVYKSPICPFCGNPVAVDEPCEICFPRTDLPDDGVDPVENLLATLESSKKLELKDVVYEFINLQPERRLNLDIIVARVRGLYPTEHSGSIRRAIRFLIDEGRASQVQDTIFLN